MQVTGDVTIAAVTQVSHKGACSVIHYPWWLLLTYCHIIGEKMVDLGSMNTMAGVHFNVSSTIYEKIKNNS